MSHVITVQPIQLTDGSVAFNVRFGDLDFPAITDDDADALATGFVNLIKAHTNDDAVVRYAFNPQVA